MVTEKTKKIAFSIFVIAVVIFAIVYHYYQTKPAEYNFEIFNISTLEQVQEMSLLAGLDLNRSINQSKIPGCSEPYRTLSDEEYWPKVCECLGDDCMKYLYFTIHESNLTLTFLNTNCECKYEGRNSCVTHSTKNSAIEKEGLCCDGLEYICQKEYIVNAIQI